MSRLQRLFHTPWSCKMPRRPRPAGPQWHWQSVPEDALRLWLCLSVCCCTRSVAAVGFPPNPGGEMWFECRPGSGPCDPKPSWPVTYAMNESVMLMAVPTPTKKSIDHPDDHFCIGIQLCV